MKHVVLTLALCTPTIVFADDQLDRLEDISEQANAIMVNMMVAEMQPTPEILATIEATLPDMEWDAPMREAGACILDGYRDRLSDDEVDDMLSKMEGFMELSLEDPTMESIGEAADYLPEGITAQDTMDISRDCGMVELQLQKMDESGFSAAMMQAAMAADN